MKTDKKQTNFTSVYEETLQLYRNSHSQTLTYFVSMMRKKNTKNINVEGMHRRRKKKQNKLKSSSC